MKVRDIMTAALFTLMETDDLDLTRQLMESERIRHIPIVNDVNELVGLLTQRDLLKISISSLAEIQSREQQELHRRIPLKEVMKSAITTVEPDEDLRTAGKMMLENKYGCLPVVENKKLLGIITEADFIKLAIDRI